MRRVIVVGTGLRLCAASQPSGQMMHRTCAIVLSSFVLFACQHPARQRIFQAHMIANVPVAPPDLPGLERHWLATPQGRIEGWILRGDHLGAHDRGPAVMIAHGNQMLIDDLIERATMYRSMGVTVLLGEYRGYGRSDGTPTEDDITDDYVRFYDLLAARPDVDPRHIFFHGFSLGGGVVCSLSRHRRPAAMILESTFTSIQDMAAGAPRFLLPDKFDNAAVLAAYDGPVLILHGRVDEVVPYSNAEALLRVAKHGRLISCNCGHNVARDFPGYRAEIQRFLADAGLLASGGPSELSDPAE